MRRTASFVGSMIAAAIIFSQPAAAGWRDDLKVLRVGFLAGENPSYAVTRLESFRWQLQSGLAVPVELFPARSYSALIEAEASGRIQYAILSSLAFVALDERCHCGEPIAQPVTDAGSRGFRAMIVAKEDGPIRTLADAKGARLAIGARDSLSGRIAPFAGLASEGIEPDEYFARIIETKDAKAALDTLAAGEADLAVAWSTAPDPMSRASGSGPLGNIPVDGAEPLPPLRLIWQSDLVPFGPHVVRTDLPPEARAAILQTLLSLQASAPEAYDAVEAGFSGGFVEADPLLYRRFAASLAAARLSDSLTFTDQP
ncbi:phosphate/phosphite/phosphonate ABC transporter substrate-binding protein [Kaistia dalseonensis]|uniref:Phosphonate transport system substrate-binding protein n=1 Tax=Kaistia dalseonensis TaxID=410840 RepID=A0ABU0HAA5_9HYPH|nr:phosphate/phosphite/phosphonate ABC transporter substrate-binding protein [Kaistia dalseonensis]MCX5496095.1 phosphate/phosphite/phosphonate ABC transporter substrate-binding protein [Kaistia dalseonensis]MDQ0438700.1 phosphonate transport system substrate-binding protein [Kaistia dalseonensis]